MATTHCGNFRQQDGSVVSCHKPKDVSAQEHAKTAMRQFWPTVQNTRPAHDPDHPFGNVPPCPCGK